MRVVVVGGSGNVGTAVLRRLVSDPAVDEVVGVVRRPPYGAGAPYDAATWESVDIAGQDAAARLATVFTGADAVVHLAWRLQPSWDVDALHRINVGGTRAILAGMTAAGVSRLVYASSIGAYAASPGEERRDESWPTTGIDTSTYSRQKAEVERILDGTDLSVLRVRPGIVLQPAAAGEIGRFFLGPYVPTSLLRPAFLKFLTWPRGLRGQIVHAEDLADAIVRGLVAGIDGGLNVATEPVVTRSLVQEVLGARAVDVPPGLLRGLVTATWRAHLQPTDAGWLDMALQLPVMDTTRARSLGWVPEHPAGQVLRDFLAALADGQGTRSPALAPRTVATGRRP